MYEGVQNSVYLALNCNTMYYTILYTNTKLFYSIYYCAILYYIINIIGAQNSVDLAQNLIWDMKAIDSLNREHMKKEGVSMRENPPGSIPGNIPWSPKKVSEVPGEYDLVENSGKISIPATVAGAILGKRCMDIITTFAILTNVM